MNQLYVFLAAVLIVAAVAVIAVLASGAVVFCSQEYVPVCGIDGRTYSNACLAKQAGMTSYSEGECIKCSDSDNGANILQFGAVSITNVNYNDYCIGTSKVAEYYCKDNEVVFETMECPPGHSCDAGFCKPGSAATCTETDSGDDIYSRGSVTTASGTSTDSCSGEILTEHYCNGSVYVRYQILCPLGYICSDGACVGKCIDSETLRDPKMKGTVRKGNLVLNDSCVGTLSVMDYYCDGNDIANITLACPSTYFCSNGECLTCTDSDEGQHMYTAGSVMTAAGTSKDYCINSANLVEYYCENGNVRTRTMTCPTGYVCSSGACISTATCTDSDSGQDRYSKGTTAVGEYTEIDYCSDSSHVMEYYCSSGNIYSALLECPADYSCSNGKCVYSGTATCTDSDGGQDRYVKGTTGKGSETQLDYCISGSELREYYCSGNEISWTTLTCPSGYSCSDGKCVASTPATCTDSDGNDKMTKGTVSNGTVTHEDSCVDANTVREWTCSGTNMVSTDSACGEGYACTDGRCVATTTPTVCTDSDGGQYKFIYGTVTKGGYVSNDQCVDMPNGVMEKYCSPTGEPSQIYMSCGTGYACSDGRCIAVATCTDSDGSDKYTKGSITDGTITNYDSCADSHTVNEWICEGTNMVQTRITCGEGYTCYGDEGACTPYCTDTDGGKKKFVFGTVFYGDTASSADYCLGLDRIREYYCLNKVTPTYEDMDCGSGYSCDRGVCVEACFDSDGGDYPKVYGIMTIGDKTYQDACSSSTSLWEFYCTSGTAGTGHEVDCSTAIFCRAFETPRCTSGYCKCS